MGMDDMVGGPIGHLVRALSGGEDAEEMLERMEEQLEAEGLNAGDDDDERMPEYMEAEIDEEGKIVPLFVLRHWFLYCLCTDIR